MAKSSFRALLLQLAELHDREVAEAVAHTAAHMAAMSAPKGEPGICMRCREGLHAGIPEATDVDTLVTSKVQAACAAVVPQDVSSSHPPQDEFCAVLPGQVRQAWNSQADGMKATPSAMLTTTQKVTALANIASNDSSAGRFSTAPMDSTHSMMERISRLHLAKPRHCQRIGTILGLQAGLVTPPILRNALTKRGMIDYQVDAAETVLRGIRHAASSVGIDCDHGELPGMADGPHDAVIEIGVFSEMILMPVLSSLVAPVLAAEVKSIQRLILTQDMPEILAKVRSGAAQAGEDDELHIYGRSRVQQRILHYLGILVSCTIVVCVMKMGLSLDYDPDWAGWTAFEIFSCTVFLAEMTVKIVIDGPRVYFCGRDMWWNIFDTAITSFAVIDLGLSMYSTFRPPDGEDVSNEDGSTPTSAARLALFTRTLRLARIFRLVKLLKMPLLSELNNMISGVLISVPWMFWIMVFLGALIYVMALVFRQTLGPDPGQGTIEKCGKGDDMPFPLPEGCLRHYAYGEEYFGTVGSSMFTCFRCIIGDCSTTGGRSLTMEFSNGFGTKFDVVYCIGMVMMLFGLFNIITAMFVESTLTGLKTNDVKKKQARLYEAGYVQKKLEKLIRRVIQLASKQEAEDRRSMFSTAADKDGTASDPTQPVAKSYGSRITAKVLADVQFTEDELLMVLQDAKIKDLLLDIDVSADMQTCIADMFGSSEDGCVDVSVLVGTIMKLRGEMQKSDLVANWLVMSTLKSQVSEMQQELTNNQTQILFNQQLMLEPAGQSQQQNAH